MGTLAIQNDILKEIMLEILQQFAQFCEKWKLRYYLACGTLLGSVRHKGYIPWDNDVDVWMPRPDYEKLIKILKKEKINSNIECLDYREVRTFPFLKLIDNRTVLKEHFLVTEKTLGVYIDIFPLDGLPDSLREQKKILNKVRFYYKLYAFANYRFNTGSNFIIKIIKNICYPFSRLVSSYRVCDKLDKLCKNYEYDKSRYVGNIVWGEGERDVFLKEYFNVSYGMFENMEFRIPGGYDQILKQRYGEYMVLPPESKRVIHQFDAAWKSKEGLKDDR